MSRIKHFSIQIKIFRCENLSTNPETDLISQISVQYPFLKSMRRLSIQDVPTCGSKSDACKGTIWI